MVSSGSLLPPGTHTTARTSAAAWRGWAAASIRSITPPTLTIFLTNRRPARRDSIRGLSESFRLRLSHRTVFAGDADHRHLLPPVGSRDLRRRSSRLPHDLASTRSSQPAQVKSWCLRFVRLRSPRYAGPLPGMRRGPSADCGSEPRCDIAMRFNGWEPKYDRWRLPASPASFTSPQVFHCPPNVRCGHTIRQLTLPKNISIAGIQTRWSSPHWGRWPVSISPAAHFWPFTFSCITG